MRGRNSVLLVTDADNTLWDTNSVYAKAQLNLLSQIEAKSGYSCRAIERLSFVRDLDQRLALNHELRLRYPPLLLVAAIGSRLRGCSPERAAEEALRLRDTSYIAERFRGNLAEFEDQISNDIPVLRPGVLDFFRQFDGRSMSLIVATETPALRCDLILRHYGLNPFVQETISGSKTPAFYRGIAARYIPRMSFSVGDQLDRDIAPAKEAGFRTIHFPCEFVPFWTLSQPAVAPDFRVTSYAEVGSIVSVALREFSSLKPNRCSSK